MVVDAERCGFCAQTRAGRIRDSELIMGLQALLERSQVPTEENGQVLSLLQRVAKLAEPSPPKTPPVPARPTPSPLEVVEVTAAYFGMTAASLLAQNRMQRITKIRRLAMFLCRTNLGMSYPEIGVVFQRDHTTVMYALSDFDRFVAPFETDIANLRTKLGFQ